MKRILLLIVVTLTLTACGGSGESTQKSEQTTDTIPVDATLVLYFHGKQRCVSCNAIEQLTKEVVDSLANEKVVMRIIDLSKAENESLADRYEVTWSALILDRAGIVTNMTDIGFGYAKDQPTLFKAKLMEAIVQLSQSK